MSERFRKSFKVLRLFQTHFDPFGPVGMCSDAFGCIWKHLGDFEKIRNFGILELFFDMFDVSLTKTLVVALYSPAQIVVTSSSVHAERPYLAEWQHKASAKQPYIAKWLYRPYTAAKKK